MWWVVIQRSRLRFYLKCSMSALWVTARESPAVTHNALILHLGHYIRKMSLRGNFQHFFRSGLGLGLTVQFYV